MWRMLELAFWSLVGLWFVLLAEHPIPRATGLILLILTLLRARGDDRREEEERASHGRGASAEPPRPGAYFGDDP